MSGLLEEVTDFLQLTPGRRAFALQQVEKEAEQLVDEAIDDALLAKIARALEINNEARATRNWWRRDRKLNEDSRHKANEIDNELDRAIGALHTNLQATRKGFPDGPRGEAASEILQALFPDGAAGITSLSFEDELSAVRFLVEQFNTEWSDEADRLGIRPLVDRIDGLADQFADALGNTEVRTTTWDEVRAADTEGQRAMLQVVVEILGRFNEPDQLPTARKLLAPILEQNDRVSELHSRNRRVTDVDPETGEEVTDPDGEPERPDQQADETSDSESSDDATP